MKIFPNFLTPQHRIRSSVLVVASAKLYSWATALCIQCIRRSCQEIFADNDKIRFRGWNIVWNDWHAVKNKHEAALVTKCTLAKWRRSDNDGIQWWHNRGNDTACFFWCILGRRCWLPTDMTNYSGIIIDYTGRLITSPRQTQQPLFSSTYQLKTPNNIIQSITTVH